MKHILIVFLNPKLKYTKFISNTQAPYSIERLERINCNLFYNIISSPDCRYEKRFADGRIQEHYKHMDAENRFKNIFSEKIIYANPKSFFVNKVRGQASECDAIKSVSFTLSENTELHKHFTARGSEYGICFFHDFLQDKGLRPVEYLNQNNEVENKKLTFNSPHLIEVYNQNYDMRWENEWRIKNNLHFTEDDIAFVIVPRDRHNYFIDYFFETEDFANIQILSSDTFKSPVDHLIYYPQQGDNSWHQVEILRDKNGNGFKIDPDIFNGLSDAEKKGFFNKYKNELLCLTKNTILSKYDFAYVSRYLRFTNKLDNPNTLSQLLYDPVLISQNISEPDDAESDLIIALFGDLFRAYPQM